MQNTDGDAVNPSILHPPVPRNRSDEPHIGKYRLIKTIGKGNFAKVKLAKHVPTGKEVCNMITCTVSDALSVIIDNHACMYCFTPYRLLLIF